MAVENFFDPWVGECTASLVWGLLCTDVGIICIFSFSGGLSRWCTGVTHVLSMIRVATLATLMLEAGQCLELLWVKPILPQFLEGEHLLYESLE